MKSIKLSERVYYVALNDKEGDLGVFYYTNVEGEITKVVSVESKEEFISTYKELTTLEELSVSVGV